MGEDPPQSLGRPGDLQLARRYSRTYSTTSVSDTDLSALQGIYKSDAKTCFGLTDKDIATLPHEAIQCSPKTFYALRDVSKLAADKFAANALPAEFTVAGEPKGAHVRFFKKGNTHPNKRYRTNWSDRGGMPWFYIKDHYLKNKAA